MRRGAGQRDRILLRPGWLSVPAAHRDRPRGSQGSDDVCAHRKRSGSLGNNGADDLGAARSDVALTVDRAISVAPGIRVVRVQLDSEGGSLSFSGAGRVRVALPNLPVVARRLNDLEDDANLKIEILRLRACSEVCSDSLAPDCRWIRGEDPPCRMARPLDKHRLDIALSAGRHAAERAKLAGVAHLIGVAPSVHPATEWWLGTTDASAPDAAHELPGLDGYLPEPSVCFNPYDALGDLGSPEIAALVGVAVAAAQMGIPFCLPDPAGGIAVDAAVGLNPGVRAWLDPIPVVRPFSRPSPERPRSLCAA